jgi:hypothetical protein
LQAVKIYRDLLLATNQQKEVNNIRYMLALRQLDENGSVATQVILDEFSVKFGVQPKTVLNRLHVCVNKGYGNFNPQGTRFYYYSQLRLLEALHHPHESNICVELDDFSGSVVEVRARFHGACMAGQNPYMTITRKSIQTITHRAKKTQRKYEKLNGTEVESNFARLKEYKGNQYELDRVQFLGHPAFIQQNTKSGKYYIVRQLANSYFNDFKKTRKKSKHPCIKRGRGNFTQIFYETEKKAFEAFCNDTTTDVYYWKAGTWRWYLGEPNV